MRTPILLCAVIVTAFCACDAAIGDGIAVTPTTRPTAGYQNGDRSEERAGDNFSPYWSINNGGPFNMAAAADGANAATAIAAATVAAIEPLHACGSAELKHKGNFTVYDGSVVLGMLIVSLGIGVFYGFVSKSKGDAPTSVADFLLGSQMQLFPVTLSLTTSFITAIELLGNPAEMYYNGTQYALVVLSMLLVIPVATKIFYPIYFKLELTSCYEYLGIRFGNRIRTMGAVLYVIQMSFYTSVAVIAPAIALSKATGLNTRIAVVLIYLVCIFYSSQGGMKAVVIADTFQAGVLAFALILVLVLGYFYTGDFENIWTKADTRGRIELFNFDPDPTQRHTVFSVVIGGFFYWSSMFCTNQASIQKCMSLKSIRSAKIALCCAILGLFIVFIINFITGLMVFAHYVDCDPAMSGEITARDQLVPFYILDVFGNFRFVCGVFVAGVFAASLGTVASTLNSLAAVTCEDLMASALNMKLTPQQGALYAKWLSLGYGLLSFGLVFVVEKLGGILQATLTLNGLVGGVTLGLFTLGIFFKSANTTGAFYGGMLSLCAVVYLGVMSQLTNVDAPSLPTWTNKCNCFMNATAEVFPIEDTGRRTPSIYRLSYMWYSFLGTMLTVFTGLLISIVSDQIAHRRIVHITRHDAATKLAANSGAAGRHREAGIDNIAVIKIDEM